MNARVCPDCDVTRGAHIGDWIDAFLSYATAPIALFAQRVVPQMSSVLEVALTTTGLMRRVWNTNIPLTELVARDRLVVEACMRAKLPVYVLVGPAGATSHIGVRVGEKTIHFDGLPSSEDLGGPMSKLSNSKTHMKAVLDSLSVPIASSRTFWWWQRRRASEYAAALPRVVVKPDAGTMDRHVTTDVTSKTFDSAFARAGRFGPRVVVEEYVPHMVVRVTVVGEDVFAVRYEPPCVVGDGVHTIEKLVEIENQDPSRKAMTDQTGSKHRILFGVETDSLLGEMGFTRTSVPQKGARVGIRRDPFVRHGSTFVDVTTQIDESVRAMALRLAQKLNAFVLGIDCIAEDISKPINEQRFVVLEVNAVPFIELHATKERPYEIGDAVVKGIVKAVSKEQT